MSRLCHWGLLAVCLAGFGMPASAEAGCCGSSWGSSYSGYTPYYAGYTPYYAGYSGYGGYTSYYGAPYASGYYPGVGCCQPSCGCAPCSCAPCGGNCGVGCASGNCSIGCSTTTNSSGAMVPTPDPNNATTSTTVESRLQEIERILNIKPRVNNKTYEDRFNSRGGQGSGTAIPSRTQGGASDDPNDFPLPRRNNTNTNDQEPFQERGRENDGSASSQGTFRPNLGAPEGNNETVIPSKKPAPSSGVEDKSKSKEEKGNQSLRLDTQVTSRAVSPRERQTIGGAAKPVVAAKKANNKTSLKVDAHPLSVDVARY